MRRVFDVVRAREWKASKLNPLFAGLLLALLTTAEFSLRTALDVIALMWVIVVNAAFGYAINNFADRHVDSAANKPNAFSRMAAGRSAAIVVGLGVVGLASATVLFWSRPDVVALCALSFGLAAAYSLPPLRFKERGWLGVVSSAFAQRALPLVAGITLFNAWNLVSVTYLALAVVVGGRFMVIHQIADAENDRQANVRTLATRLDRRQLERLILNIIGPLELLLVACFSAATFTVAPASGATLAAAFLVLAVVDIARVGIRSWYVASSLNYWGYDRFYVIAVPVILTASILWQSLADWPLGVVCIILVAPEVARSIARIPGRLAAVRLARSHVAEERRWTQRETPEFPYPVGLLLFNRPDYAVATLDSLLAQSTQVDPTKLFIHIDGYAQSQDQAKGLPDQTAVVAQLARERFPEARILTAEVNAGIAMAYEKVEAELFADDGADWAVFLEEDFVLYPTYLQTLRHLIAECTDYSDVVMVSATGDLAIPTESPGENLRGMGHSWAYALRRDHAIERRPFLQPYLESVAFGPYWMRDNPVIWNACAEAGFFPMGTSQDYVKRAIMLKMGGVALTTLIPHGYYVGESGEHFTPEAFLRHGYDVIPHAPHSARFDRDGIENDIPAARYEIEKMMAKIGVTDIINPLSEALRIPFTPRRWDTKDSPAMLEGPFPELDLNRPFVWLVDRATTIQLTVNATSQYEIHVTLTNYHRGQIVTITSGNDVTEVSVPICTQAAPTVIAHIANLTAGVNDLTISYSKSKRGAGDSRQLGVALLDIDL